ncbi:MAG: Putative bacterial leucyl aminopeptidase (Lap module) [candidate division TA06 bacterium 32_111]|uniref:Fibronectin type-III domain-containing protein n=2 Tax=Bacteria candidate phyla TaxID=1783234 RepID=A0A348ML61_UNCW3|nr:MAG: Putative bacterial leucyl aminopeptidase (Lap module) [candidate division TA06 bacterium 32_111]KUK87379.1 MAG: Putative bacterial leucyl aminopeptidase (Lap module) [candidate division TA06 bacterium 34_109]HAF07787.1 hypothetical protein [candidate division WOR-3 bacterium]HCP17305.1 hypothetical protein [candidate division WOR-3 bacterium]
MKKILFLFLSVTLFLLSFSDYIVVSEKIFFGFDPYYLFDGLYIGKTEKSFSENGVVFKKEFRKDKNYFVLFGKEMKTLPEDYIYFNFEKNLVLVETDKDIYIKGKDFEIIKLNFKNKIDLKKLQNQTIPSFDIKKSKKIDELTLILSNISSDSLYNNVAVLSGEYPYPQGTYSKSRVMVTTWLDTASVYLFNRMSDLNLDSVFYQDFMVSSYPVRNIVGLKKGLYSKDTCIVVGAHYDDYSNDYQIAPGADDNASGSSAVLELSRTFSSYNSDYDIYFVLFTAEEWGLYGSEYFVYDYILPKNMHVLGMLNFDMIGYNPSSDYRLNLYGMSHSNPLKNLYKQMCDSFTNVNCVVGGGSSGSDHYFFDVEGFKVNFAIEYTFSPVYHSTQDSISYMNFDYMKEVVKGGAATLYYLKNMPATVSSISLKDKGDSSVIVGWQKSFSPDVIGYKIYYKKDSDTLENLIFVPDTNEYRVGSLIPKNLYYFKVTPVDSEGFEGFADIIDTITPSFIPNGISLNSIYSDRDKVYIYIQKSKTLDFLKYNVYRKKSGETDFTLLTDITDTFFIDSTINDTSIYLYTFTVVDSNNLESEFSNIDSTRLLKMEKEFLVVDETSNGASLQDQSTDAFYDSVFGKFVYDRIDMDSISKGNNIIFGNYKKVFYIDDDLSNNKIDFDDLSRYIENGGRMIVTGWNIGKSITENPTSYPVYPETTSFAYKLFNIFEYNVNMNADMRALYYNVSGRQDSVKFVEAKLPRGSNGNLIYGGVFELVGENKIFGQYISSTMDTNFDGKTVLYSKKDTSLIIMSAPIYYMETEGAKRLISDLLNLFNVQTGIDGKDNFVSIERFEIKYLKGNINIYYENVEKKDYTLKLIDVSGRVQDRISFKIKDDKGVLTIKENLKKGVYFINVSDLDLTKKIFVIE